MSNPQADPKGLLENKVAMPHHSWHMRRALRLAEKARGWTLPNPLVGALIIKDERRIGEGHHTGFGKPHAEVEALASCTESPEGATLYVTLEPCPHQGKTPPCTDAILKSGIAKVVIAALDPSEKANGKGVKILKDAGLEVEVGLLNKEAMELNKEFFTFHQKKRPFITLKAALSLGGKISMDRESKTSLTGDKTQIFLHQLRHEHQAILVGAGTVLSDNPHLGVRQVKGRDPLRIILQGERELPMDAHVFRDSNFLVLKNQKIESLLKSLYEKEVISVLVEGGSEIFTAFLEADCVDEMKLFIAPIFLGESALPFANLKEPLQLKKTKLQEIGRDFLLTALVEQSADAHVAEKTAASKDKKLNKQVGIRKSRKAKQSE